MGARPALSPLAPLIFWALAAAVLTAIVLVAVPLPGPLDDPDQGEQRSGVLVDRREARRLARGSLPADAVGRRLVAVIFDRSVPRRDELASLVSAVPKGGAVVLVVAHPSATRADAGIPVTTDTGGRIAVAVGMPRPRDGGPPVGYAIVDEQGYVRYATLDPTYTQHASEIHVVMRALT